MKTASHLLFFTIFVLVIFIARPLEAKEMRELQIQALEAKEELIRKAQREKAAAEAAAAESRMRILHDKDALEQEIIRIGATNDRLSLEVNRLEETDEELAQKEKMLNDELGQVDAMIQELVGGIRSNAKDLDTLINQNLQTGIQNGQGSFLTALSENVQFPGMDDIIALYSALMEQIRLSKEVSLQPGTIIDRAGRERYADILLIGPFTGIYRSNGETGFLNYSASGKKLYALSHLPSGHMQKELNHYIDGKQESVPVDISRGAALRQLSHELNLTDQIAGGGLIVWPIIAILVIGLFIVFERAFILLRNHHKNSPIINRIQSLIQKNDWRGCEKVCEEYIKTPIARVLLAGIRSHTLPREDMENALQEAILREIPALERFLSTLGMLVAIAPLLGLLGTVTGMINVFHVITLRVP